MAEVCHGVAGVGRAKVVGTVWASTVVMPNTLGSNHTQVLLTEDQHTVGGSALTEQVHGSVAHLHNENT